MEFRLGDDDGVDGVGSNGACQREARRAGIIEVVSYPQSPSARRIACRASYRYPLYRHLNAIPSGTGGSTSAAIFTRLREARLRDAPIGLPRVPASGPATARSQTGGSQTGGRQTARGYATDQATACPRSTASSGVEGLGEEEEEEEGNEWLLSSSYEMSSEEERRKSRAREEESERVSRLAEE